MRKKLFVFAFLPLLGIAQNSSNLSLEEKRQIKIENSLKTAFYTANQVKFTNNNKAMKQVLDSALYEEIYTNPDEYYRFYKYEFKYNSAGMNTAQYTWIYDFQNDTLGKAYHTYNSSKQLIETISYVNNGSGWELDTKKTFSYAANGLLIKEIDSTYDTANSMYKLYMDLSFTYDVNNRVTEIFALMPEPYADQKIIFEYNADGTLSKEYLKFENVITLTYDDKRIYSFDYVNTNSSITHKEKFDSGTQTMINDGSIAKFYDLNINKADLILPSTMIYTEVFLILPENLIGSYTSKLDSLHDIDNTGADIGRMRYFYNQKDIVGLTKISKSEKFKIYPNPTSGNVYFDTEFQFVSLSVYDLYGKLVFDSANSPTLSIDLSKLENGIYTVFFYNGLNEFLAQKKVVVNK